MSFRIPNFSTFILGIFSQDWMEFHRSISSACLYVKVFFRAVHFLQVVWGNFPHCSLLRLSTLATILELDSHTLLALA